MAGQVYPNKYMPQGWEFRPTDRGGFVTANIKLRSEYNGKVKQQFIKLICFGQEAQALRNELTPGRLIKFTGEWRENGYRGRDGKNKRVQQVAIRSMNGRPAYELGPVLRLVDEMPAPNQGGYNNGGGQQQQGGWGQPPQQQQQGGWGQPNGGPPQQPPHGQGRGQPPQQPPAQFNTQQPPQQPQGGWAPPPGGPPQQPPQGAWQPAPQPTHTAMPGQGGFPQGGQFAPPPGGPPQGTPPPAGNAPPY